MWYGVVVAVEFDVVVDVDPHLLPLGVLVGLLGKGAKSSPLQGLEQRLPAAGQLPEGTLVQPGQQLPDRSVHLLQREEHPVPQPRQDPPLYHLHGHFHLSLVPRPPHPCRYHSHTVVSRHLLVGGIDVGLVEAGLGHAALQVVGNDHLRDTTNEAKGPDVGTDPVGEPLSPAGLGVGVAARPQHRDEDLRLPNFTRGAIHHRYRLPSVVPVSYTHLTLPTIYSV